MCPQVSPLSFHSRSCLGTVKSQTSGIPFLKMTCLQEQCYLPAKSCAVVSIQPAKRRRHQQHSHHQDQLEAYMYKAPVVESVECNRHKDKLVVHRTYYKCEKGSSFCCSN